MRIDLHDPQLSNKQAIDAVTKDKSKGQSNNGEELGLEAGITIASTDGQFLNQEESKLEVRAQAGEEVGAPETIESEIKNMSSLLEGYVFLKYGKHGEPGYRIVRMSPDLQKLEWVHNGETKASNSMKIRKLVGIKFGRHTGNFTRFPIKNQRQNELSFTIFDHKRALDLEANIQGQLDLFIEGLASIIQYHNTHNPKLLMNSSLRGNKNKK